MVSTFLLLHGPGTDESECPPLELVLVFPGQRDGFVRGRWLPNRLDLDFLPVRITETVLDKRRGELGNVDSDPLPVKFLGCVDRCPATAERVEHQVAGIAAGPD